MTGKGKEKKSSKEPQQPSYKRPTRSSSLRNLRSPSTRTSTPSSPSPITEPPKATLARSKSQKHPNNTPSPNHLPSPPIPTTSTMYDNSHPSPAPTTAAPQLPELDTGSPFSLSQHTRISTLESALSSSRLSEERLRAELQHLHEENLHQARVISELRASSRQSPPEAPAVSRRSTDEGYTPRRSLDRPSSSHSYSQRPSSSRSARASPGSGEHADESCPYLPTLQRYTAHLTHLTNSQETLLTRLHSASKALAESQEETEHYRRQVLDLKRDVAERVSGGRLEGEGITDGEVEERLGQLRGEVMAWVVGNMRRAKLRVAQAQGGAAFKEGSDILAAPAHSPLINGAKTEAGPLQRLADAVPLYRMVPSAGKLALLQSVVVYNLMEIFDAKWYFGLPPGSPLDGIFDYLSKDINAAAFTDWRLTTLRLFLQREGQDVLRPHTEKRLGRIKDNLKETLQGITDVMLDDAAISNLRTILDSAVAVARLLKLQRAEYRVQFPQPAETQAVEFDPTYMEDVGGSEEEDDASGDKRKKVMCTVFPCFRKYGDEQGENMHLENIIFKARVLCTEP